MYQYHEYVDKFIVYIVHCAHPQFLKPTKINCGHYRLAVESESFIYIKMYDIL